MVLEGFLLGAILCVSLAVRLHDLEGARSSFPDLFDEGQDAHMLMLMSNGFWPHRDIYVSQGPMKLLLMYPGYALFGGTIGAVRLWIGLLSLVGLLGAWWAGRLASGVVGGLMAAFLLSASPAYLEASRLSLAEMPSLVPCIWAVGCGLRYWRGGAVGWLYAAATLATIGLLVKPMALPVVAPLGLLLFLRRGFQLRQALIVLAVVVGITTLAVLATGPGDVYEQVVQYRVGARQAGAWNFRQNFKAVLGEPFRSQPGLFILAVLGALLLASRNWRRGLALAAWPVVTAGVLLSYYPLHPKHLVYLYPPLTLLAAAGLGRAARLALKSSPAGQPARLVTVGLAALLAVWPLGAQPTSASDEDDDPDLHVFDRDAAQSLAMLAGPRDFVLTDHPYVGLLARRMVPPRLVDISLGRIRAGVLTDAEIIEQAQRFDVEVVLTWADRLRRLPGIPPWLDNKFQLSQIFGNRSVKIPRGAKDRSIYLRRDTDLTTARSTLEAALNVHERVDFDGQLRLLGAGLTSESVSVKEQFTFTLAWLALAPMSTDYHIAIQLISPDGETRHAQEHDLEGSVRGTSTWEPGRWLFRTFAVQPKRNSPAGEYRLQISVIDPKTGNALRPEPGPGAVHFKEHEPGALTVGTIQVY